MPTTPTTTATPRRVTGNSTTYSCANNTPFNTTYSGVKAFALRKYSFNQFTSDLSKQYVAAL